MKNITINFKKVFEKVGRDGGSIELCNYIENVFAEMQENANIDNTSISQQLDYANMCGSYTCNTNTTVNSLSSIYYDVCDFIKEYEKEYEENLSSLYFENIEAFEIYLLYDLYFKYIQEYDAD